MKKEAVFITKWKAEMTKNIKMRYKDHPLSDKKIDKYLDKLIKENIQNPEIVVENNYRGKTVDTDLLSLIDTIEENQLIIGGGGVLFVQHNTKGRDNVMYGYIVYKQAERAKYKAERKKYPDETDEWVHFDIEQNRVKTGINSLYGVHGYELFVLYNRFIAESITNCGKQIITTAVMTFENFLSGSIQYNTDNEIFKYITNICNEYDENIDYSIFVMNDIDNLVYERITSLCAFRITETFEYELKSIISNLEYGEKVLLYYKNNLIEFSKLPFIAEKLKFVVNSIDELKAPDKRLIKDDTILQAIDDIWDFYNIFVMYNYPVYGRVRKAMFTDRTSVLYVDTDSNFLGLNEWVTFIKNDILRNDFNKDEHEINFIAVNLLALYLSNVIDLGLHTLCKHMNIKKEFADRLNMKNEFYLDRIIFTDAKKRYVSNSILQEGALLNYGNGKPDIKGFDFKKAGTKQYLKEKYTDICLNDILRADEIDVEEIYRKILRLKDDITDSVLRGESNFFKQANVQLVEYYKNPYSTQQLVAVTVWNALNPSYAMDLPTDCDLVPIVELTGPKINSSTHRQSWPNEDIVRDLEEKYPEVYDRLDKVIYQNPNPLIRNMSINCIAKPKLNDIPLPEWFSYIVDVDKVTMDALNLIAPILKSLGLNGLKTNASTEYMTNIIDL